MSATPMKSERPPPFTPGRSPRRASDPSPVRPRATPARPYVGESNSQAGEGIQVAIRMRPLNSNESSNSRVWKVLPKYNSVAQTTIEGKPMPDRVMGRNFFTFDKTFAEDCSTAIVYEQVAKDIVKSASTGLNGTIFAYGQTSSGKTYTMQGSGTIAEGSDGSGGGGIVHMAAQDVFRHIAEQPDRVFLVRASFLEIYNEEVRDLLNENRSLQIREDPRRGVFVQSKEKLVTDFNSLLEVLFTGEKSRAFASTAMNERSSRSHTIFRITIESHQKELGGEDETSLIDGGDDGAVRVSTLNLVDLAGSESVRHTGATGDRQKEGGMINQSLLTLSRVIVALGTPNQGHINFRDSKLTRILQPSLSGNARMAVVCCATPSELYLEETRSTLLFASRAKLVQTNAQVNEVLDDRSIIRRLQRELALARKHGGGIAAEDHARVLGQQAEKAESAARATKEKLKRLYAAILNSEGSLLGDSVLPGTENIVTRTSKRRRRFSDDNVSHRATTPAKNEKLTDIPQTLPRRLTKEVSMVSKGLSTSAELAMLRQVLSTKSNTIQSMANNLDVVSNNLQVKESELLAAKNLNDQLKSDRDDAVERGTVLELENDRLTAKLEVALSSCDALLRERDTEISEQKLQLEREQNDRRVLEETIDSLQEDNGSLQKKLNILEKSTTTQIEKIENDANIELQKKVEQIDELSNSNQLHINREAQLEKELASLRDEYARVLEKKIEETAALQSDLSSEKNAVQLLQSRLAETTSELSTARAESIVSSERIDSLEQQLTDLDLEVVALGLSNSDLAAEVVASKIELSSLNGQLSQCASDLSESKIKLENAQSELHVAHDESSRLSIQASTETAALQVMLETKSQQIELFTEKLEETSLELSGERKSRELAEKQVSDLRTEMTETNSKIRCLTIRNTELHSELDSTLESMQALTKTLDETVSRLAETSAAKERAEGRVDSLLQELAKATAKLECLEGDIILIREGRAFVDKELESNLQMIEIQTNKLEEANFELSAARTQKESAESSVERLRGELAIAIREVESSEAMMASVQHDLVISEQKHDADNFALQKKLSLANDQVIQLRTSLEDAVMKLSGMRSEKEAADEWVNNLSDQLVDTTSKLTSLETTFASYREEANSNLELQNSQTFALRTDLTTALHRIHLLEISLEESVMQVSTQKSQKVDLTDQLKILSGELLQATSNVEAFKERIAALSTSLEQKCTDHDVLRLELEEVHARRAQTALDLEKAKNEGQIIVGELRKQMQHEADSINTLRSVLAKLTQQAKAQQYIIDGLVVVLMRSEIQAVNLANEQRHLSKSIAATVDSNSVLTASLQAAKADTDGLRIALGQTEKQLSSLIEERDALLGEHRRLSATIQENEVSAQQLNSELLTSRDELIRTHDILETTNKRYNEMKQRSSDLEDELESKVGMLSQGIVTIEEQRDQLALEQETMRSKHDALLDRLHYLQNEKLELESRLLELHSSNSSAESQVEALQGENKELKLLLVDSNYSVKDAREAAEAAVHARSVLELELNQANQKISNLECAMKKVADMQIHGSHQNDNIQNRLEQLTAEKQQFESALKNEREDRRRSEAHLKRLMGEEQRSLIQDAEQTMGKLRDEIANLQHSLQIADAEAYASRQMKDNLEDQQKLALSRGIQLESKISALEKENARLRRASARQDSDRDAEIATLRSNLQTEKAERLNLQKSATALEKQMELAKVNEEKAVRDLTLVRKELACMGGQNIKAENSRLQAEIKQLQAVEAEAKTIIETVHREQMHELRTQLSEMTKRIESKDERIAKLERSKLTKEKIAAIKACKDERMQLKTELGNASMRIKSLQHQLTLSSHTGPEASEITKLRFDNEALEGKVRKFALHCQQLEDEKENIIRALGLKRTGDDISKAIFNLCDKVSSLESECGAMSKPESHDATTPIEVDQLREKNTSLKTQISDYQKKIDKMVREEAGHRDIVAALRRERDELKRYADGVRGKAENFEMENSSQLRYLQQENSTLMAEVKAAKKQMAQMKAEIKVLRDQCNASLSEFVLLPKHQGKESKQLSHPQSRCTPSRHQSKTPGTNEENSANNKNDPTKSKTPRTIRSSTRRNKHHIGLGEAFAATEENTQECKQS